MSNFKAKMHQIRFPLGLRPRPRWGACSALSRPLAVFTGPTSKWSEGKGRGGEGKGKIRGKGKEGKMRGGKGKGPRA